MAENKPLWSVPVTSSDITETGRRFDLAADEGTRAGLAKLTGLRSLPQLQATFDVAHHGSDGLRVSGRIDAVVGQTCGVTLEPMENKVEEKVDLLFLPPRQPVGENEQAGASMEIITPDAPEPLIGDRIDLGAIATEFLILGIDSYPRKPDAAFAAPAPDEDPSGHPFAALAALKKGEGKKDG